MAISFGAFGTAGTGSTTLAGTTMPAHSTGDILTYFVESRPGTVTPPAAPSGWALQDPNISGGQGAEGADAGTARVWAYTKTAASSSETVPSFTITGASSSVGVIHRYSNATGAWDLAHTGGADNAAAAAWSATGAATIDVTAGDWIVTASGINSDGSGAISSRSITVPGCTMGTQSGRAAQGTTTGNDSRIETADRAVSSGNESGAPVYTCTHTTTGTNFPAGATMFLRLREVSAGNNYNLTPVTETDAAQSFSRSRLRSLAVATVTHAAQALSRTRSRGLTSATEVDAAVPLVHVRPKTLTPATEADAVVALSRNRSRTLTALTEADAAASLSRTRIRALTPVTDSEAAQALSRTRIRTIAPAVETDIAQSIEAGSTTLTPAVETDAVVPLVRTRIRALAPATETPAVVPLSRTRLRDLAAATTSDLVTALLRLRARELTPSTEADAARALVVGTGPPPDVGLILASTITTPTAKAALGTATAKATLSLPVARATLNTPTATGVTE